MSGGTIPYGKVEQFKALDKADLKRVLLEEIREIETTKAERPWTEAHRLTGAVERLGLRAGRFYGSDNGFEYLIGRIRRLLDELASDGELVRFGKGELPPGTRGSGWRNGVEYGTPELVQRRKAEVQAEEAEREARADEVMRLVRLAGERGLRVAGGGTRGYGDEFLKIEVGDLRKWLEGQG